MVRALAILLIAGCGGPQKPAEPQPQPRPKSDLDKVDRDVERVKEIAELDRGNVEKQVKIGEMEKKIAELQAKLDDAVKGSAPKVAEGKKRENLAEVASGNRVRVRLSGELVFSPGSARITRAGR